MARRDKNIRTVLKEKGFKITPVRVAMLELLQRESSPMNVELILKKLSKLPECQDVNEVTVYRTLGSFEKEGIIRRIDLRKDSVYFELNTEHHHHIVCTNCNVVEDFENKEIEKALERIVSKASKFKSIKEHSLELFGLCRACA